jgi:hypothetical protein
VSQSNGLRTHVVYKCRKIWFEIVTTTLLKLLEEVAAPIGVVDLKTVAEDRIRQVVAERL